MLTREQKIQIAASILARGSALAPDRFPAASAAPASNDASGWGQPPSTSEIWADALGGLFDALPVQIWPEVVNVWATEMVGDRMVTLREIKAAAYTVRDRWESNPTLAQALRERRQHAQDERDRQIKAGTFAQIRGHKPRAIAERPAFDPTKAEGFAALSRLLDEGDRAMTQRETSQNEIMR